MNIKKMVAFGFLLFCLIWVPMSLQAEDHPLQKLSREEYLRKQEIYRNTPVATTFAFPLVNSLPIEVNLKNDVIFWDPDTRDQGNCGNCWAWAATSLLDVEYNRQFHKNERFSVQYITSCAQNACGGGSIDEFCIFYSPSSANPINPISWWDSDNSIWNKNYYENYVKGNPMNPTCGNIVPQKPHELLGIQKFRVFPEEATDEAAIKAIKDRIAHHKAVWIDMDFTQMEWSIFDSFFKFNPGIYKPAMDDGTGNGGGHAMACIGYYDDGDGGNEDYWIVLNSYGKNAAHPDGTFKMTMDLNYGVSSSFCDYPWTNWYLIDAVFNEEPAGQDKITSPAGDAVLQFGDPCEIKWNDLGTADEHARIYLMKDGSWVASIANDVSTDSHLFNWTVGKYEWLWREPPNAGRYKIRIATPNDNDPPLAESEVFTIDGTPIPIIVGVRPTAGESLSIGDTYTVSWDNNGYFDNLKVWLVSGSNCLGEVSPPVYSESRSLSWSVGRYRDWNGVERTAAAGSGYKIQFASPWNAVLGESGTFAITGGSQTTYTITATAGTGGTITPSGNVSVAEGGSQTFTISASSGYVIGDVHVDTISWGAISSYTFDNVTANHTIAASFIAAPVYAFQVTAPRTSDWIEPYDGFPVRISWNYSPNLAGRTVHIWLLNDQGNWERTIWMYAPIDAGGFDWWLPRSDTGLCGRNFRIQIDVSGGGPTAYSDWFFVHWPSW